MNVCLLSSKGNFDSKSGKGTQRYAYELSENLSKIGKRLGVNVDKTELGFGSSDKMNKVTFTLSVPFHSFSRYDLIHLPAPIIFVPPLRGRAAIVTTATEFVLIKPDHPYSIAIREAELKYGRPFSPIGNFITSSCIRQALNSDFLITISSIVKEEAIARGFRKENIYVTNLGVDPRFSKPKSRERKKGKFVVGYLGALNVRKNVKFAIKAFKQLRALDAEFRIYGKKSLEYDNLAALASGDNRIKFMGFAPEDKIVDVYDGFDVFVYPILYTGFELEILEAQARGLPVITYKKSTIPGEVRRYCLEADDEMHMSELILDIKKNGYDPKIRETATKYARSFTWKRCAEDTISAYKDIMKRRN